MSAMTAAAVSVGVSAAVVLAVMCVAFVAGLRTGRHRGVDVAWGLAFVAVAATAYVLSAPHGDAVRRALVLLMVAVWGLRLSVHLWWRARGAGEDPRYERLIARLPAGHRTAGTFAVVYLLQTGIVWFVSLPLQVAMFTSRAPGAATWAGVALWTLGLTFETVGDAQLSRFRADPGNRGRILDSGLWRWTRHPNYFGDACVWWGLFLTAVDTPIGWAFVLSPVVMTWLLAFGSGKPLLERDFADRKPGWDAYAARTSGFVPLPPRSRTTGDGR